MLHNFIVFFQQEKLIARSVSFIKCQKSWRFIIKYRTGNSTIIAQLTLSQVGSVNNPQCPGRRLHALGYKLNDHAVLCRFSPDHDDLSHWKNSCRWYWLCVNKPQTLWLLLRGTVFETDCKARNMHPWYNHIKCINPMKIWKTNIFLKKIYLKNKCSVEESSWHI